MASVNNDKKTSAEKAVDAKPATDGPHSSRVKKVAPKEKDEAPAYVVTVKKSEEKEKLFYKPEELRAKARSMLGSGKLSPDEQRVLADILGPEKET